jgi:hypothetical protein
VDVHKVGTSCGWSIPKFQYLGERDTLKNWAVKRMEEAPTHAKTAPLRDQMEEYQAVRNAQSLDGIVGLVEPQRKVGLALGDELLGPPVFADMSPYVRQRGSVFTSGIKSPRDVLALAAAVYLAVVGSRTVKKNAALGALDMLAAALAILPTGVSKNTVSNLSCALLGALAAKKGDRMAMGLVAVMLASSAARK